MPKKDKKKKEEHEEEGVSDDFFLSDAAKTAIGIIVLATLAVLLFLSLINTAGPVGVGLASILKLGVGWLHPLFPIFLILIAISMWAGYKSPRKSFISGRWRFLLLLGLLLSITAF